MQEQKGLNKKKIAVCLAMAIWTILAFTMRPQISNIDNVYTWAGSQNPIGIFIAKWRCVVNGYNIQNAVLTILLAYGYYKMLHNNERIVLRKSKLEIVIAIIFSLCMILGQSFQVTNSLNCVFGGFFYCSMTFVRLVGYIFFFFIIIQWLVGQLYDSNNITFLQETGSGEISYKVFDKHAFGIPFLIIIICWLPYMIACFPGVVQWDGLRQLTNAFHLSNSDNSHPLFTTLLMGGAMKLGRLFGSDNLGIFFYVFPQMIIAAGITGYSIMKMKSMKSPYWLRWITLGYFSLISMWPLYAVSMFKDTLFYIIFLMYIILLIDSLFYKEQFWKNGKNLYALVIVLVLLELIRPNGIHIVILSMPIAVIAGWKGWKNYKAWICVILSISAHLCFNNIVAPSLGVSPGRVQEAFCIPFQQTARYIREYPEEVTEQEKQAISKVLEYDLMAEKYDPEFVDPVKSLYKSEASNEDIAGYFKVWFQQFCKHPGVYFEATLNGSYGYFYPNKTEYREGLGAYEITYDPAIYTGEFDISMVSQLKSFRKVLENMSYIVRAIPIIGLLFSNGIYTWILLFCIVVLLKRYNWRYIVPYIPAVVVVLFCIASPVNAYIRYMRPVMVATPILVAWMIFLCSNYSKNENETIEQK